MSWSRAPLLHSGQMLFTKPMIHWVVDTGVTPIPPPVPAWAALRNESPAATQHACMQDSAHTPLYMMHVPHALLPSNMSLLMASDSAAPSVHDMFMLCAAFSEYEHAERLSWSCFCP